MKVFLGGTCNGSKWRDKLIPKLGIEYFNPVVGNWTKECRERELKERRTSDFNLYVLTPKMTGTYAIAEVIDDSNKRPKKTIMCVLREDEDQKFTPEQLNSLVQVAHMAIRNGAWIFDSLDQVAEFLNSDYHKKHFI